MEHNANYLWEGQRWLSSLVITQYRMLSALMFVSIYKTHEYVMKSEKKSKKWSSPLHVGPLPCFFKRSQMCITAKENRAIVFLQQKAYQMALKLGFFVLFFCPFSHTTADVASFLRNNAVTCLAGGSRFQVPLK